MPSHAGPCWPSSVWARGMWFVKEHSVSLAAPHWWARGDVGRGGYGDGVCYKRRERSRDPPMLSGPASWVPAAFPAPPVLVPSASSSRRAAPSLQFRAPPLCRAPSNLFPKPSKMSGGLQRSVALVMAVAFLMQAVQPAKSQDDGEYTGVIPRQTDG